MNGAFFVILTNGSETDFFLHRYFKVGDSWTVSVDYKGSDIKKLITRLNEVSVWEMHIPTE